MQRIPLIECDVCRCSLRPTPEGQSMLIRIVHWKHVQQIAYVVVIVLVEVGLSHFNALEEVCLLLKLDELDDLC